MEVQQHVCSRQWWRDRRNESIIADQRALALQVTLPHTRRISQVLNVEVCMSASGAKHQQREDTGQ
jgi:hypothetical protein